jgi:hypothetical protein
MVLESSVHGPILLPSWAGVCACAIASDNRANCDINLINLISPRWRCNSTATLPPPERPRASNGLREVCPTKRRRAAVIISRGTDSPQPELNPGMLDGEFTLEPVPGVLDGRVFDADRVFIGWKDRRRSPNESAGFRGH